MILENEISKLKKLVDKLIESVTEEINLLSELRGSEFIKEKKSLVDVLNKLVKITLDINKSLENKKDEGFLSDEDKKIIDQFYKKYNLEKTNEK